MKKTLLIALIIVFLISSGFFLINVFRNQNLKTDNNTGKSPPQSVSGNNPTPDEEDEDDYKGYIPTYIDMDKIGASIIHTSRDLEQIKQYIANGGDVNERTLNGKTPLHLFRTQEIMEFLIKKGADINTIDMMGNTPVMSIAAWIEPPSTNRKDKSSQTPRKEDSQYLKNLNAIRFLVDKGADIKAKNYGGENLIYKICSNYALVGEQSNFHKETEDLVKLLIEKGVDFRSQDFAGRTPLHTLCSHISEDCCLTLFIKNGADVNTKDFQGQTPLHLCTDKEIAKILTDNGADVNAEDENQRTPLFNFLRKHECEIIDLLISKGADINHKDTEGKNAAAEIISFGSTGFPNNWGKSIFDKLTRYGLDFKSTDNDGRTLLFEATDMEYIKFLLKKGLKADHRDIDGRNILYKISNPELREYLVKAGAKPDIKDKDGISIIESDKKEFDFMVPGRGLPIKKNKNEIKPEISFYPEFIDAIEAGNAKQVSSIIRKAPGIVNKPDDREISMIYETEMLSPLEAAVVSEQANIVKLLVKSGAVVNKYDKEGNSALTRAISTKNQEIINFLIKNGALKKPVSNRQLLYNPLAYSIMKQDYKMAKFLISKGVDISCEGSEAPPLFAAASMNNREFVDLLLSKGVNINLKNKYGKHIVFAYQFIPKKMFDYLILKGADINIADEEGKSVLSYAAELDNISKIRKFIGLKADVNKKDKKGRTPLHKVTYPVIASILLKAGADINAEDNSGRTPLMTAENPGVAEFLIKEGAKEKKTDKNGATILHIAAADDNDINLYHWIKNGMDINAKDNKGRTPLHYLILYGPCENPRISLHLMLINKANPDITDNRGKTPLHYAVSINKGAEVPELLQFGANPNKKDKLGNTPLHYAAALPKDYFVAPRILLNAGADPNIKNNKGETPMDIARKSNRKGAFLRRLQMGVDNRVEKAKKNGI